jgi:hypothetical protein
MNIEIKNILGKPVITFSHFKKEGVGSPAFVSLLTTICINGFETKSYISVELTDLSEMLFNLKVLDETLKRTFFFQHIDERLIIKFEPNNTGQILISGKFKSENYSTNLEFKFETSQELIPELIKQCEEVVKRFSGEQPIDKYL